MRSMKFSFFIIGMALIFASCGKKNTQGRYVPKNANFVLYMDGKELSSKLSWDEIKQNPLFQQAATDSSIPPAVKSLIDNPENAGLDPKNDLLMFAVKDSLGGYVAVEGMIKDEAKFKAFNKQLSESGTESSKGDIQFISKAPVCVGWTKDKFIYVIDAPQMGQMDELSHRMMRDSIDISTRAKRDIGAACKAIFDLDESGSLATDKKFSALMKEKGDVRFYMNYKNMTNMSSMGPLSMLNLDKLQGNITTGSVDFTNGKIVIDARTYPSDDLAKIFKKYSGGKIDEDMLKRMPGKNFVAAIALNFKPEALKEFLKLLGLDGLINLATPKIGFSLDDFLKANKGDIAIGLSDFAFKTDSSTTMDMPMPEQNMMMKEKPTFNFIFSTSIGDKESFSKILDAGKKLGGSFGMADTMKDAIAYGMNGQYFAIANSKENVDKFLAGGNNNADYISKISGEPFGGFFNIQSILQSVSAQASKDSLGKVAMDASIKLWDNVLWKGGNFSDDAIRQKIEINFMDKNTNSLKQLNGYAAVMGGIVKEKKRKEKEAMMAFEDAVDTSGTNK